MLRLLSAGSMWLVRDFLICPYPISIIAILNSNPLLSHWCKNCVGVSYQTTTIVAQRHCLRLIADGLVQEANARRARTAC